MQNQAKKVVLISSQYLFRDPRYLLFAKAYKNSGFEVVCINVLANITYAQRQTDLYRGFTCHTILGKNYTSKPRAHVKSFSDSTTGSNSSNNSPPSKFRIFYQSITNKILSCVDIKLYVWALKIAITIKEQLVRPIYLMFLHQQTKKAIKSHKFRELIQDADILHGCELLFGNFAAGYAAQKFNKKFIFDAKEHHRYMVPEFSTWTINFIKKHEKILFGQADIITCVSKPIIDCYAELYPEQKNKFLYIPNCQALEKKLPNNKITNRTAISNIDSKISFVVLATYLPFVRGIEYLIQLWNKLAPNNAELYIYLSNLNSVSKNYLSTLAHDTKDKSLFLMPPVKEDLINSTVAQYDVGIIPYLPHVTLNHLYCCPNKFGQYLAAGLAIMSSDTENIPAQIKKQNLGFVYPTQDIDQAVDCFRTAIFNSNSLVYLKDSSSNYFHDYFNWDNFSLQLMSKIEQL